jgi:hypothetical protein
VWSEGDLLGYRRARCGSRVILCGKGRNCSVFGAKLADTHISWDPLYPTEIFPLASREKVVVLTTVAFSIADGVSSRDIQKALHRVITHYIEGYVVEPSCYILCTHCGILIQACHEKIDAFPEQRLLKVSIGKIR